MNSRGATLQGDTLVLTGVTPSSIIFADRPVRSAGHQPTADVIAEWGSGDDSFAKNPPNATVLGPWQGRVCEGCSRGSEESEAGGWTS